MNMSRNNSGSSLIYLIFAVLTAMIGKTIHGSTGWAIADFFFCPFAWIKWLICHEVTLSIIKKTFTWFFV
jgi:hypothetical protein